jgi:tRNA-specific 2-thiouridylase
MSFPGSGRALAAISGGVDSSVAALLAQRQGLEIEALTLSLPGADLEAAAGVAERLGVSHHVADVGELLEQRVIAPFLDEYARGRTPNPCLVCNAAVKFATALEWADRLGCERVVTGHYAKVGQEGDEFRLLRGDDRRKDQSYMLYRLDQEALRRAVLPLGSLTKTRVRELAAEAGLPTAERPDSQDICFVAHGDAGAFVQARRPEAMRPGPIVDRDGRWLGQHAGLAAYTVGQRRGLGIGGPEGPYYVLAIRADDNALVVGSEEDLWVRGCELDGVHLVGSTPGGEFEAEVMTRYRGLVTPARVRLMGEEAGVSFERPHRAPAPGQAAVFYEGERLVGGGTIRSLP